MEAAQADLPALDEAERLPPAEDLSGPWAVLIVGAGSETTVGARRRRDGADEFDYEPPEDGDGTVPLDLALVPGLPTYAARRSHGAMPNDTGIARASDNIPSTGATAVLEPLDVA